MEVHEPGQACSNVPLSLQLKRSSHQLRDGRDHPLLLPRESPQSQQGALEEGPGALPGLRPAPRLSSAGGRRRVLISRWLLLRCQESLREPGGGAAEEGRGTRVGRWHPALLKDGKSRGKICCVNNYCFLEKNWRMFEEHLS